MQGKKQKILDALAKIVKEKRGEMSITQLALSADISKSIWFMIEQANRDAQLTTIFKIAEAFNIKPSQLLEKIESELGETFQLSD